MTEKMSFGIDVDKELIEKNVTALVAHAIADALGDKEALVNHAVTNILQSYVDRNGVPCSAGDWNKQPYLQYLAKTCVENTIREEIKNEVENNKETFKEIIKKELSKPKYREQIASSFIGAILENSLTMWKMPVTINFEKPKD